MICLGYLLALGKFKGGLVFFCLFVCFSTKALKNNSDSSKNPFLFAVEIMIGG